MLMQWPSALERSPIDFNSFSITASAISRLKTMQSNSTKFDINRSNYPDTLLTLKHDFPAIVEK